jgi:hypothetical protein
MLARALEQDTHTDQ